MKNATTAILEIHFQNEIDKECGDPSAEENLMLKKLHGILFMNSLSILSAVAQADAAPSEPHNEVTPAPVVPVAPVTAEVPKAGVDVSAISVHGTGCDAESTKGKSIFADLLLISFDPFEAQAHGPGERVRKTCSIRIPVTVPPGFKMGLHRLEIEGQTFAGPDGNGDIVFRANRAGVPSKMVWSHVDSNASAKVSLTSENPFGQPQDLDWLDCNEPADVIAQIDLIARQDAHIQLHELYMPMPELKRCDEQE